jgi:hypothetical protein
MSDPCTRTDLEYLGKCRAWSSAFSMIFLIAMLFSKDKALAWAVVILANEISWSVLVVLSWLATNVETRR